MGTDNKNNTDSNSMHNLFFFIIIVLLCAILYFTSKPYIPSRKPVYIGSLEHYDSLYDRSTGNISMDGKGNVTGYNAPDGTHYTFDPPIPAGIFYDN